MQAAFFDSVGSLTSATGQRVSRTVGSAVAGVGNVFPGFISESPLARPDIKDPATDEAYEEFKRYSVESNVRAGERRVWHDTIDKVISIVLFGASAGIATVLAGGAPVVTGLIFFAALATSVAASYYLNLTATRDLTGQTMDVKDFQLRREASFVAKALKQALDKEGLEADIVEKEPEKALPGGKTAPAKVSNVMHEGIQALPPLQRLH